MNLSKTVSTARKAEIGIIESWIAHLKGPLVEIFNPRVVEWGFGKNGNRKLVHVDVRNRRDPIARHCHAVLSVVTHPHSATQCRDAYPLNWAFVPDHPQMGTPGPVDLGPSLRRLDIVYTDINQAKPGCWISRPSSEQSAEDYLPPGDYEVDISIQQEGKAAPSARKRFVLRSPRQWDQLKIFYR